MQNTIRNIIIKQVKLVDKDQKNNIGQKIIDNKYVICLREMLGAGAYASVYKGYFVENPLMKLSIKVIPVSKLNEKQIFKYFQREQQIASKLNHPNIVQFIDVCQNEDNLYLILEYCEEGNLKKILDQQPKDNFNFKKPLMYSQHQYMDMRHFIMQK